MTVEFKERPSEFLMTDGYHPLKSSLFFAGLGRDPFTTRYTDSSLYGNTGTLSGSTWTYNPTLGRNGLAFSGSASAMDVPTFSFEGAYTISVWLNCN